MKTFLKIVGKYQSLIMFAIVAVVCTVCALNGPEHVTGICRRSDDKGGY